MAGETTITVIGNLTNDPELRFTPSGSAVANFTIASTPRTFDRQSNEWKDGETLFLRAAVWREAAENVAESLTKGMRVIVTGRLKSRSYETKEGEKRTVIELEVDEIGPSLRYANAKVNRTQRSGGQGGGRLRRWQRRRWLRRRQPWWKPGRQLRWKLGRRQPAGCTGRSLGHARRVQRRRLGQRPRFRTSLLKPKQTARRRDCPGAETHPGIYRRRTTTIPWINIHGLPRIGAPRWLRLNSVSPNQSPTP